MALGASVGIGGRVALLVVVAITLAWGLVGALLVALVNWLEQEPQGIELL